MSQTHILILEHGKEVKGRNEPPQFRPDIEGLRAVAVLLVVVFHAQPSLVRGGFVGVDVFFVLSGYLITALLARELAGTGRVKLLRFYARRAKRLLPAAVLMLVATVVVARFVYSPLEQSTIAKTAESTAVYLSNMFFMQQDSDYFGTDITTNPLLHTWSLAVEEQFYLVWPILIVLFSTRPIRSSRRLLGIMATVSGLSLIAFIYLTLVNRPWAFFGSPFRAWEFGLGGLISFLPAACLPFSGRHPQQLCWLGLSMIVGSGLFFSADSTFLPIAVGVPTLGTALVLIGGSVSKIASPLLCSAPFQVIGKLSYSWYLWHWPVLVLGAALLPKERWYTILGLLLSSLLLAAITNRFVENPIRFNAYLSRRSGLCLILSAAVTGIAFYNGALWLRTIMRSPEYQRFAKVQQDIPRLYRDGCHADLRVSRVAECVFGDASSSVSVVLFGDSKAAQWFPALELVATREHWRLLTLTHSACPASDLPTFEPKLGRPVPECALWRAAAISRISSIHPALVVISQSSEYDESPGHPLAAGVWRDGTRRTLSRLASAGLSLALLEDSPHASFDVPTCLARLPRSGTTDCYLTRNTAFSKSVSEAEREAIRGFSRVSLVDLTDQICGPMECNPIADDGTVVYRDRNHLTATYVRKLSSVLAAQLIPLIMPNPVVR